MRFFPQRQPQPPAKPSAPTPESTPAPVYQEEDYGQAPETDYEEYEDVPAPAPAPTPVPSVAAARPTPPPAAPSPKPVITQPQPTAPVMPENPNKNILSKDVEIKGNIRFTNELIIDGKIEGEIFSEGVLTVGENADIRGEVKTKSVTVLGKVQGNITVTERAELKARAHLIGDLKAARLVIEEGATFVGKSEVTSNKANVNRAAGSPPAGGTANASSSSSAPASSPSQDEGSRGTSVEENGGSREKLATFGR